MPHIRRIIVLLGLLSALAGCNTPLRTAAKSPLAPAQMSSDSVVLEMFFVRCPFGDEAANGNLWKEINEQQFDSVLREQLARNGFRVGVINGQMPAELSKLMQLSDKQASAGDMENTKVDDLNSQSTVTRRHLQLRSGQRSEILASGVYDQLPVLMCESGQLCGQTYNQAQGIFGVKSFPQPDGRVRIELAPELQYDQPRQHWVGSQGMLRLETSRPKRAFDNLILSADLSPGAMLVLTSLPNRAGSLGHHFFTENTGHLEQKLLIVRLSQTQHDGLFDPPDTLKLDE